MNISGNISSDDLDRVNSRNNPPSSSDGFDIQFEGGDDIDSLFDSIDSLDDGDSFGGGFGSSGFGEDSFSGSSNSFGGNNGFGNNGFGNNGFGNNGFGNNGFGAFGNNGFGNNSFGGFGNNGFGNNGFGNNSFGGFGNNGFGNNGFGNNGFGNNGMQQADQKRDAMDVFMEGSIATAKNTGMILFEMLKSFKLRNMDDYGYLGRNLIIAGLATSGISLAVGILGSILGINFISFKGLPAQSMLSGILSLGVGMSSLGVAAFVLCKIGDKEETTPIESISNLDEPGNEINSYESSIGAETDDLFGEDFDSLFNDFDFGDSDSTTDNAPDNSIGDFDLDINTESTSSVDDVDFSSYVEDTKSNQYITRELLFNTFKPMLPLSTPNFNEKREISRNSSEFNQLETICLKALSNVTGTDLEELDTSLESAYDNLFSYELKVKRIKKMKKLDELAREIEVYTREDENETGVNASVNLVGDYYKIVITKGTTAVITIGDVIRQKECEKFILSEKNVLPIISGIDELGNVMLEDAKKLDSMLIAGKPRSGKSWYILSILSMLTLFNTPEDVQIIIYDPKRSPLFKAMSLMPHVCGFHDGETVGSGILDVMDDIINVEAPRRKKLLDDANADDIWALRKQGIKLPILYLFIDEYITVRNKLGEASKELDAKLQTIISNFPSRGIRVMFVPHRATGVVDKTNRTMLQFTACVKSDNSEIIDTLDIKKWDRPLVNPGDIALKTSNNPDARYVRGTALTTDDEVNAKFIRSAAKIMYKMGVDLPDMSGMAVACNRDNDEIRMELDDSNTIRVQFDGATILNDIE